MPKETSNLKDYEKMVNDQKLIMAGDHPQEDKEAIKRKYTPPPEGVNHPGQLYN